MILKMFSVFDSKVGAYLPPLFMRSNGEAIRAFSTAANSAEHDFCKFSADYTLFEIGAFHDDTCKVNMLPTPKSLGVAIEFVSDSGSYRDVSPAVMKQVVGE